MKCQNLFSGKNIKKTNKKTKKNNINLSSAELDQRVAKIKQRKNIQGIHFQEEKCAIFREYLQRILYYSKSLMIFSCVL